MNYLKQIQSFVTAHSNPILIGTGLATLLGGVTALVPISFKAGKKVAKIEAERGEKLSKPELVNLVWKNYITPTFMVATGTGLIAFGAIKQEMKIAENEVMANLNSFNAMLVRDGYADVNSYCDYMGLRNILYAGDVGWDGMRGPLDISFRGDLVDNKAVKVIELSRSPGQL